MSKTTYTAGVDLFLVDGEIYLLGKPGTSKQVQAVYNDITQKIGYLVNEISDYTQPVLYSTKQIKGVHLLDRNSFVKGVDLEELEAVAYMTTKGHRGQSEGFELGFKAGYKSNKNEFTWEEMEKAFCAGCNSMTTPDSFKTSTEFITSLRPLSLPSSLTIENNEIIEVKWTEK